MDGLTINKLAVIGAGHMAEAMVRGIVRRGLIPAGRIHVADVLPERPLALAASYGITPCPANADAVRDADGCLLAVKPQHLREALSTLADALPGNCLILSVAAGVRTAALEAMLPAGQPVIRTMPNTPALVGAGVTGICPGRAATAAHLAFAQQLFNAVGLSVLVEEKHLDAITALSGSGPAYVFYWIEAMLAAAETMGVEASLARTLVSATFRGAVQLLGETGLDPAELRRRVTSKGGTTEAALRTMDARGVADAIQTAVLAAQARSRELSA